MRGLITQYLLWFLSSDIQNFRCKNILPPWLGLILHFDSEANVDGNIPMISSAYMALMCRLTIDVHKLILCSAILLKCWGHSIYPGP